MNKECLLCGHRLVGRTDKKFCNEGCRYTYHNRINRHNNNASRRTIYKARKNQQILERLINTGKGMVSRTELLKSGFSFAGITGVYPDAKCGQVYEIFRILLQEAPEGYLIKKRNQ